MFQRIALKVVDTVTRLSCGGERGDAVAVVGVVVVGSMGLAAAHDRRQAMGE